MKWKLGRAGGINIYVHWSFWLLPAWVLVSGMGGAGGLPGAIASVLFVFAIFGCVVLHELGHAFAARYYNIGTRNITLYPIGGVASLERMPRKPLQELVIALAGPAVNVVIAGLLLPLVLATGIATQGQLLNFAGGSFLLNLLVVNIALVVFNMLPAFPMDGGRVLRAFLAMNLPYLRATEIAARVGQVVAILLGLLGLLSGGTLVFVALFVYLAAQAELAMVRRQAALEAAGPLARTPFSAFGYSRQPHSDSGIYWLDEDELSNSGLVRIINVRR